MIRKFEETPEWWAEYDAWKAALRPDIRSIRTTLAALYTGASRTDKPRFALQVVS